MSPIVQVVTENPTDRPIVAYRHTVLTTIKSATAVIISHLKYRLGEPPALTYDASCAEQGSEIYTASLQQGLVGK